MEREDTARKCLSPSLDRTRRVLQWPVLTKEHRAASLCQLELLKIGCNVKTLSNLLINCLSLTV